LRNAGIRKARQRKPKLPNLARLVIDDADPYAGWTDEEDDEDWAVPEELRGLDRADAARTRVVPHRRSPAIAEDVRANTGEAKKLLRTIQRHVLGTWRQMAEWYWCEDWATGRTLTPEQQAYVQKIMLNHDAVAQGILRKYVVSPASWIRTAYYSVRGQIHDTVVPEATFRQFFEDYVRLRGGMGFLSDFSRLPDGKFMQVVWEDQHKLRVAQALAVHAHLLAPLVDAIRAFGFVSEDHTDFQVLWRFHPVRHNNTSIWHMDENPHMIYGDESMRRADAWTRTGTRAVVTTSCLSIDPRLPADQCSTRILSGVPAFTEQAINGLLDELWEAKDTLLSYKCARQKEGYFGVMINQAIRQATERAIAEYTAFPEMHDYTRTAQDRLAHQARVEAVLAAAGVETMHMRNGEIGTFNDHQYHASSAIPEGQVRLFFVVRGQAQDVLGTPVAFREDARIVDRQGRLARLSFEPV
jgi:hypothetical protein